MQFVQAQQQIDVEETDDVEVEYVTESLNPLDPNYRAFAKIFEAFKVLSFLCFFTLRGGGHIQFQPQYEGVIWAQGVLDNVFVGFCCYQGNPTLS